MEVSELLLADYASVNDRGKFTLVGAGFTEITTKSLPCIYPLLFIFIRVKVFKEDIGCNRIGIQIVGNEGPVFKAKLNIQIAKSHHGMKYVSLPTPVTNLKFPYQGIFSVEVKINGSLKAKQNLKIRYIEKHA